MRAALALAVVSLCLASRPADAECTRGQSADDHVKRGRALVKLAETGVGPWAEALPPLQAAIAIDPSRADAHGQLGWVRLHMDDEAEALREWTQAVRLAPDDLEYYLPLADLYRRLTLDAPEEKVLEEALSFAHEGDPRLVDLHEMLGELSTHRRDFPRAVSEYEAARRVCPASCGDHPELYFHLGAAYAALTPPRKSEALQQLHSFFKMICKGARAAAFAATCSETTEISRDLGAVIL